MRNRRLAIEGRANLIQITTLLIATTASAASLDVATLKAWEEYVESVTTHMEQRLSADETFLWADEEPDRITRIRAGDIPVSPVGPKNPKRAELGLIHHWVGAVFIPGVGLKDAMTVLRDYNRYKTLYQPTVIYSKMIATSEAKDRFSLLLINKSVLKKTVFAADVESSIVYLAGC
jgi:hypothetical protein